MLGHAIIVAAPASKLKSVYELVNWPDILLQPVANEYVRAEGSNDTVAAASPFSAGLISTPLRLVIFHVPSRSAADISLSAFLRVIRFLPFDEMSSMRPSFPCL